MSSFQILQGENGLDLSGDFRPDPWYLTFDNKIIDFGFGKPPKSFFVKKLDEGSIIPGLVNSHSHIELSYARSFIQEAFGVHEMAEALRKKNLLPFEKRINDARLAVMEAKNRGTFFFVDIANDPIFSGYIADFEGFLGIRFLELLGFSPERSRESILKATFALKKDFDLSPCPHSIYGSSPYIMNFISENIRKNILTIHFLESEGEKLLFQEMGSTKEFLIKIGQWHRYSEFQGYNPLTYVKSKNLLGPNRMILVHLNQASNEDIDTIINVAPNSAFVICERSNLNLGYLRQNLKYLVDSPLTFLIGTDSLATSESLCVLDEMVALHRRDEIPEAELWKSATFNAYRYLKITKDLIPYYLFLGSDPSIESISNSGKAVSITD